MFFFLNNSDSYSQSQMRRNKKRVIIEFGIIKRFNKMRVRNDKIECIDEMKMSGTIHF